MVLIGMGTVAVPTTAMMATMVAGSAAVISAPITMKNQAEIAKMDSKYSFISLHYIL